VLGRDNITLLTGAEVTKLETDSAGRARHWCRRVSRGGDREVYTGDIVVLSAGAANSAKLLLTNFRRAISR
jgi:choline dehydrogenase-like flavoprotein